MFDFKLVFDSDIYISKIENNQKTYLNKFRIPHMKTKPVKIVW